MKRKKTYTKKRQSHHRWWLNWLPMSIIFLSSWNIGVLLKRKTDFIVTILLSHKTLKDKQRFFPSFMFRSLYISLVQSLIFSQYKEFEALLIEIHGRRYCCRRLASNKANHFSDDKKTYILQLITHRALRKTVPCTLEYRFHWLFSLWRRYINMGKKSHLWAVCMLQTILTQITNIGEWQIAINVFQTCSTVIRLNFNQITVVREEFTEKKPLGANLHFQQWCHLCSKYCVAIQWNIVSVKSTNMNK